MSIVDTYLKMINEQNEVTSDDENVNFLKIHGFKASLDESGYNAVWTKRQGNFEMSISKEFKKYNVEIRYVGVIRGALLFRGSGNTANEAVSIGANSIGDLIKEAQSLEAW